MKSYGTISTISYNRGRIVVLAKNKLIEFYVKSVADNFLSMCSSQVLYSTQTSSQASSVIVNHIRFLKNYGQRMPQSL